MKRSHIIIGVVLLFVIPVIVSRYNTAQYEKAQEQASIEYHKVVKERLNKFRIEDSIKNIEKEKQRLVYEEKFKNSKAGKIWAKHPEWSMGDCEKIALNMVWVGMTLEMLKYERGLPNHVNKSDYGGGVKYQWCWTDESPSCFYGGVDGIITAYN
jgi:hypothetical protein